MLVGHSDLQADWVRTSELACLESRHFEPTWLISPVGPNPSAFRCIVWSPVTVSQNWWEFLPANGKVQFSGQMKVIGVVSVFPWLDNNLMRDWQSGQFVKLSFLGMFNNSPIKDFIVAKKRHKVKHVFVNGIRPVYGLTESMVLWTGARTLYLAINLCKAERKYFNWNFCELYSWQLGTLDLECKLLLVCLRAWQLVLKQSMWP